MSLELTIAMQDGDLLRFGQLLENLKAQKAEQNEENDERAIRFNEGRDQGSSNIANAMMWFNCCHDDAADIFLQHQINRGLLLASQLLYCNADTEDHEFSP